MHTPSVDAIDVDLGRGPNGGKGTLTEYNTEDGRPIIQREGGGYYTYDDEGQQVRVNSPTDHGNTIGNQPADVYKRYDADGNYLKTGISQDANTRYSDIELANGSVDTITTVPRTEAIKIERIEVETNPGPLNKEPWAGKKDPTHPNYDPNYKSPYDKR